MEMRERSVVDDRLNASRKPRFHASVAQLRAEVAAYLLRDIMSASAVLQQLDKLSRQLLAAQMTPRMVAPGHDLCLQGDPADRMWLLQDGAQSMPIPSHQ